MLQGSEQVRLRRSGSRVWFGLPRLVGSTVRPAPPGPSSTSWGVSVPPARSMRASGRPGVHTGVRRAVIFIQGGFVVVIGAVDPVDRATSAGAPRRADLGATRPRPRPSTRGRAGDDRWVQGLRLWMSEARPHPRRRVPRRRPLDLTTRRCCPQVVHTICGQPVEGRRPSLSDRPAGRRPPVRVPSRRVRTACGQRCGQSSRPERGSVLQRLLDWRLRRLVSSVTWLYTAIRSLISPRILRSACMTVVWSRPPKA